MDCTLTPCAGGYCCERCGAGPYRTAEHHRNCGKPAPLKPTKCPQCQRVLDPKADKKRLERDGGKWHWWCPDCHTDVGECSSCNAVRCADCGRELPAEETKFVSVGKSGWAEYRCGGCRVRKQQQQAAGGGENEER